MRALHFLATSAVIAEAGSGIEATVAQIKARNTYPDLNVIDMTVLPSPRWPDPHAISRVSSSGHSSQYAELWRRRKGRVLGLEVGLNCIYADNDAAIPMSSGDLIPNNHDQPDPASNEVQFALVIARMIDTVKNSPEDMRQAVYDLARYKLQEQFTHTDARDIRRTQQALESAIRGVEEFSKQQIGIPSPPPAPQLSDGASPRNLPAQDPDPPAWLQPHLEIDLGPGVARSTHPLWPLIKRTAGMLVVLGGVLGAIQQRERLASLVQYPPRYERQAAAEPQRAPTQPEVIADAAPKPPPAKPNPLRPTDYGVYAIDDDSLAELQLLPGRPPDIRVAVSAAFKVPSRTVVPNGHPKFVVFRRDAATNFSDHAEVRIIAKVGREFSADAAGKKPDEGDDTWVIRNVSFPLRSSPVPDRPEMYELHSEDPALELTPGRYALILKNQAYDFSVGGEPVDPRQCIERVVATTGTFYADCKKS